MALFNREAWAAVPFHFWSLWFFWLGSMVGSFLNVCIHRMPRNESIVWPPSHCPSCNYRIPWFLNMPLITWLYLRGRCANCKAPISMRYFWVELFTAVLWLSAWLVFGHQSPGLALAYCVLLSGFIVASFIDLEHFIIPDEITLGGAVAGFCISFLVPRLHGTQNVLESLKESFIGIVAGAGIIYAILRVFKLFFGRQRYVLAPDSKIIFGENGVILPDQEILYADIFHRKSDVLVFDALTVHLGERQFENVTVSLKPGQLTIGTESFNPEEIQQMEATAAELIVPREVMGLGDVKFMAAIGAFLGWKAVLFTLMFSSAFGSIFTLSLVALGRRELSNLVPYGPYIAMASTLWIFGGQKWAAWWFNRY